MTKPLAEMTVEELENSIARLAWNYVFCCCESEAVTIDRKIELLKNELARREKEERG